MPDSIAGWVRASLESLSLPARARAVRREDRRGLPDSDIGAEAAIAASLGWLGRAQDHSATADGGVSRHFSLVSGWGSSYPETTGYIVPTVLACATRRGGPEAEVLRVRARKMLDWLVSIQLPGGGFQGGMVDQTPVAPVTFNTGQILMGLSAGLTEFGEMYRRPTVRAANWLLETQDPDGCWRANPSPFAGQGEKTYDTHVAWGMFEASRATGDSRYSESGLRQVEWALTHQRSNGWMDRCCLTDPTQPLTHTLGYTLRGILEAHAVSGTGGLLSAARRLADGLLSALRHDGWLPGRLRSDWSAGVPWVCLTGSVQIAHCWLLLFRQTGDRKYRDAGLAANRFVRRTMLLAGPADVVGGVKGSFPVDGGYGRFEYLNWAAKFFIDSHLCELSLGS
jgi:hypothetical protein